MTEMAETTVGYSFKGKIVVDMEAPKFSVGDAVFLDYSASGTDMGVIVGVSPFPGLSVGIDDSTDWYYQVVFYGSTDPDYANRVAFWAKRGETLDGWYPEGELTLNPHISVAYKDSQTIEP